MADTRKVTFARAPNDRTVLGGDVLEAKLRVQTPTLFLGKPGPPAKAYEARLAE